MTAAARKSTVRVSALAVFVARAEARALLWSQAGEFHLHQAVDLLQADAERTGLVDELGQDCVQELMVEAFAPLRDDLAVTNVTAGTAPSADDDDAAVTNVTADEDDPLLEGLKICADTQRHFEEWERRKTGAASSGFTEGAWAAPDWHAAAVEYQKDRGNRPRIVEIEPERLVCAQRLLADDVSLERAYAEVSKPAGIAESTLRAAEFLLQQKDPARLRAWLDRHSPQERAAILHHLEQRKRARAS